MTIIRLTKQFKEAILNGFANKDDNPITERDSQFVSRYDTLTITQKNGRIIIGYVWKKMEVATLDTGIALQEEATIHVEMNGGHHEFTWT